MMRIIIYLFCLLLLSNCGFSVLKRPTINYEIVKIDTIGDKKINFKLRNDLLFLKENNQEKLIEIKIETIKNKDIKEKNDKNEITKYEIYITTNVEFNYLGDAQKTKFTIIENGDYNVEEQHSKTVNNEKNLIKILSDSLSEKLIFNLTLKLNDL